MSRTAANSPALPIAGPYSHSIVAKDFVYVSGQLPISPDTGKFVQGNAAMQAKQSLDNIQAVLAVSGLTMDDIVKCTIFFTDMNDFAAVNEVYGSYFSAPAPARSAFAVAALPGGAQVEIEAIAQPR